MYQVLLPGDVPVHLDLHLPKRMPAHLRWDAIHFSLYISITTSSRSSGWPQGAAAVQAPVLEQQAVAESEKGGIRRVFMHVFQGCITDSLSWGHSRGRRVSVPVDGTGSGTHAGVALCGRRCMRRVRAGLEASLEDERMWCCCW